MYIWIYQHSWDSSVSTTWWEMHAPNNMMELPFPPCACGHMHTPQTICAAGFGKQRAQRKKETGRFQPACFYVFSATAKYVPAATCLYFSVENQQGLWKGEKKTLQSVSFNSSSVAEVVGWQLCVSPSISKQCLSLKTNSCQLHSPKVFNVFAFVRHFEKCIYSSENTFKREISWLFYFRKFSEFMGILVWEEFLICMLCHDISEKYSFYNGKKHQKKISKYTV